MRLATRLAVLPLLALACGRRDPIAPDASPSAATAETASPLPAPSTPVPAASSASHASVPAPSSSAADPALLPQTRDRPSASGAAFEARAAALWAGIVEDDPERAMPFFFPLGAYEQVKDIGNPASDWKRRLVTAFAHDIRALHARLGDDASKAKLVALDISEPRARWVDPGEEYNKIGYFRVFGSKLRYEVDGATHAFDVKSLISWRGEWYVVHLSAIQ